MQKFILLLLLLFTFHDLSSLPPTQKFVRPAHVDPEIWESVAPCFLPENHPIKPKLDLIFSGSERVISSEKTLKKAGFKHTTPRKYSGIIVTTHRKLKGYVLKLYTDDQVEKVDWANLKDRVTGANSVRASIAAHHFDTLMKTPHKWIYPLPASSYGSHHKNFILVEEDMRLVDKKQSLARWSTKMVGSQLLNAVYTILNENGLADCAYAFNMPFSQDGRIAFIDTELHHRWPVPFEKLTPYLSPMNQKYWRQLIERGGAR